MCVPFIFPAIGAFASMAGSAGLISSTMAGIVGGIASIGGTIASTMMTSSAQRADAKAQQQAYDYNARVREQQAQDARQRGSLQQMQLLQRSRLIAGAQRAQQGASGVVGSADSGADILVESTEYGARDAELARINAEREATGFQAQANLDRYQGQMARYQGQNKIAGTMLTGFTNVFAQAAPWWKSWQQDPFAGQRADVSWSGYGAP
jgi:hypothetical protein